MVLYQDGTFTDPLPSEVTVNTDDVLNVGVFLMDAKEADDYRQVTHTGRANLMTFFQKIKNQQLLGKSDKFIAGSDSF